MRATEVPDGRLYAVGDVNGRNLLTHMGKHQARVCGDVIVARVGGRPDDGRPPARSHHRGDRRGRPGSALARRSVLPGHERDLAEPPAGLRHVTPELIVIS
ncbi:hypothetical protein Airi01_049790 [Actinoallomurus iriomotensis]|uniref:Uncharacterized protein n=1 Tax=Actinoallomurus iriomotensis TaxID=478107 RepID=A0A9W6RMG5_9ACTN|nr:hypothetical protein Airi01_049790 [Actinoallomurus iriomotensis]